MEDTVKLAVGDKAPDFEATITNGTTIRLSEILGSGEGIVLYFYPKDNTPGCTTEACDFRDNFNRLQGAGWRVIGVSKDLTKSHTNFANKYQLPFDLIVDEDIALHKMYGAWKEKRMYGKTFLGCLRSTFAIAPDRTIVWAGYGVRAKGHVDRLMNDLGIT